MNRILAVVVVLACAAGSQALADSPDAKRQEIAPLHRLIDSMHDEVTEQGLRAGWVFGGRRVRIAEVVDSRPGDHQVIGWNDKDPIATREDLGAWLAAQLADSLRSGGVEVVDGKGDVTISATIVEAVVTRSSRRYVATVTIEWAVSDASGRELWRGKETGSADERGRFELDSYGENFEKATMAMFDAWSKDPQYLAAVRGARSGSEGGKASAGAGDVGLTRVIQDLEQHAKLAGDALAGKRVSVAPIVDLRRGDHAVIGRNVELGRDVTAREDVAQWLTDRVVAVLRKGGVEVVASGADVSLAATIVRGKVEEGDRYLGVVALELAVNDSSGHELWRRLEVGVSDAQEGKLRLDKYAEGLSDAFLLALDTAWSDPQLLTALGRPAPERKSAPPPPGAQTARSSLEGVRLQFQPSDGSSAVEKLAAQALAGRKVVVRPFEDGRPPERKRVVGRHAFAAGDSLVTTSDDVGVFCAAQLSELLKRAGVAVVPDGGDLTVSSTIRQFMVEEQEDLRANTPIRATAPGVKKLKPWMGFGPSRNPYFGTVVLEVVLEDAAHKPLWRGAAVGVATNWGMTFTLGNHRQAISDALVAAYGDLFEALSPVTAIQAK